MIDMTREKIKEAIGYGQRTNRFYITFPAPFNGNDDDITYLVMSSVIPGSNIGLVTINCMGGLQYHLPGDATQNQWNVTFRNPQKHGARKAMQLWMDSTVDNNTGARGDLDDVKKMPEIKLLDNKGSVTASFKLKGSFITAIEDESLDYEGSDTISTFGISMSIDAILYNYE